MSDFGLIETRRTVTVPEASLRSDVPASVRSESEIVLTPSRIADPHALSLGFDAKVAGHRRQSRKSRCIHFAAARFGRQRLNGCPRSAEEDHARSHSSGRSRNSRK